MPKSPVKHPHFVLSSEILRGLPYNRASLFGTPDLIADHCFICGNKGQHIHHMAEKGMAAGAKTFRLHGRELESGLIRLCVCCHALFHADFYAIEWQWRDFEAEKQWWDGSLFAEKLEPKDPILFAFGRYVIYKGNDICRVIDHA